METPPELIDARVLAEGFGFPEGPVWMPDGSLALCDIEAGEILSVAPDGSRSVLARTPAPNGLALGPDGGLYVADNGGFFTFVHHESGTIPTHEAPSTGSGAILRVDPVDESVTTVLESCDGRPLVAPNDLVFDAGGGIWFTDHGVRVPRSGSGDDPAAHEGSPGLLWCRHDGSGAIGVAWGLDAPNGVGLSPDGRTVYVAETYRGDVYAFDVTGPGVVDGGGAPDRPHSGRLVHDASEGTLFDSLAVDAQGRVWVATIGAGGITVIPADGGPAAHVPTDDFITTNLAWGGPDMCDLAVTLSSSGRLLVGRTSAPGLRLSF